MHPNRVHITVSVVDQPKPDGGVFRGVCSSFLQRLEPPMTDGDGKRMDESGDKRGAWPSCRIFVRASSFRLPADPKTPIFEPITRIFGEIMPLEFRGVTPFQAPSLLQYHLAPKIGDHH